MITRVDMQSETICWTLLIDLKLFKILKKLGRAPDSDST